MKPEWHTELKMLQSHYVELLWHGDAFEKKTSHALVSGGMNFTSITN